MTSELRIRDSHSSQETWGNGGTDRQPPAQGRHRAPGEDTGEAAWDVAEPLASPSPDPRDKVAAAQDADELPAPFPMFPGMGSEEEEAPKGPSLDIRRLVRGVLKRLWLAASIAFFIAALFLVAAVALIKPKWEAVATVMVHTRQDEFSLGGAKPFESQDYNLRTMLDTIKLPSALMGVSESLGLNVTPRALSPAIDVRMGKESNLFQVVAVWKDPGVAANIANKVAEQLVQRSRDLRRADAEDAYANYSSQLEAARNKLSTVTEEVRVFKATHQVSDFGAETQVLLDALIRLETELNTKTAETQAMREALVDIEKAVKGEPEMVVTSTVYRNPIKTRLTEYEWQLQEARSRYTEQNPKVIKLQTRVDVLKQMIKESNDEGAPENLYSANTKLVDLQERQRELASDVRVRDAQIAALSQTVDKSRAKLAALTAAEKDFQLLQQRLTATEKLESNLVGRVEEARVMMLRNEAAFELFEAARPPTEPAPSKKKLVAVAGVVLGGGAGLFVALFLELLDPLLRTRRDLLGNPGVELTWEFQHVPQGHYAVVDAAEPGEPVATLFRRIINDLDAKLKPTEWTCMGVTSADPKVGRTLVATNLAQSLSMKEYPVTLIDADLRSLAGTRPGDLFEVPPDRPGLLEVLRRQASLAAVLTRTETPELSLLAAGDLGRTGASSAGPDGAQNAAAPLVQSKPQVNGEATKKPAEPATDHNLALLGSRQFSALLQSLRESGQHLVYDLPPLGSHETVLEAATSLGNVILVARSGQTTRSQFQETVQQLEDRGTKVRGVLITDVPIELLEGAAMYPKTKKAGARRRWFRRSQSAAVGGA
jgi:succinoglycan biosynthesis transport protein ExoP